MITDVIKLNLKFNLFAVFIIVENLFHILALKYGNLFHRLSGRLILSKDLKKQSRNRSLPIAPADYQIMQKLHITS